MLKKARFYIMVVLGALLLPQTTRTYDPSMIELITTQVVLMSATKGLEWLMREDHMCPVYPLQQHQPCPLLYFRTLATASEAYVMNLKKIQAMDPENPEVLNLLGQGIILHKKFQLRLQEAEALSEKQRGAYRLTQERNFSERDLKILALLKDRDYKDVPQEVIWQAKKAEYQEVSPGIYYSKDFMQQHEHSHTRRNNL